MSKDVKEWIRLPSTREYLTTLFSISFNGGKIPPLEEVDYQYVINQLQEASILTTRYGRYGGTWSFDNALTVAFARYCDPYFSILCDKKIAESLSRHKSNAVEQIKILFGDNLDLTNATHYQLLALNTDIALPPHIAETHFNPTDFGNKFLGFEGSCGKKVNLLLMGLGLIERYGRGGKKKWKVTAKGAEYLTEVVGTDGIHKQICIKHDKANQLRDRLN